MDKVEKKSSKLRSVLLNSLVGILYVVVGSIASGLGFIPLLLVSGSILEFVLFNLLGYHYHGEGDIESFMVIWLFWIPAVVFGAIGGLAGAAIVRIRFKLHRFGPWIGAVVGGLIPSFVMAMLMMGQISAWSIAEYRRTQAEEMRPKSDELIPSLAGSFQELTAVSGFESLAVSSDSRFLAIAANHKIILWDLEQNSALGQELIGNTSTVNDMDFSLDGSWLVSGSEDQKMIAWSVPDGELVFIKKDYHSEIYGMLSVAVSPDNKLVASGDGDGVIILRNLSDGHEVAEFENLKANHEYGNSVECLSFSPDSKLLASCSNDYTGGIILWDVAQYKAYAELEVPRWSNGSVTNLSFSPDGSLLAGVAYRGPVVWDVETQSPLGATQEMQTKSLIDFSPDGRLFVFTSASEIYIYDALTLEPVGKLVGPSADSSNALFLTNSILLAWYSNQGAPTKIGLWNFK